MISTLMSGYFGRSRAIAGQRIVSVACSTEVMRTVPAGLSRSALMRRNLAFDLVEPRPDPVEQTLARLGQGDAARRAGQQPKAEPRLQSADGVAQRRLGNAELGGSLGEAPLARDRDEGEEVVQIVAAHSEIRLLGPCR